MTIPNTNREREQGSPNNPTFTPISLSTDGSPSVSSRVMRPSVIQSTTTVIATFQTRKSMLSQTRILYDRSISQQILQNIRILSSYFNYIATHPSLSKLYLGSLPTTLSLLTPEEKLAKQIGYLSYRFGQRHLAEALASCRIPIDQIIEQKTNLNPTEESLLCQVCKDLSHSESSTEKKEKTNKEDASTLPSFELVSKQEKSLPTKKPSSQTVKEILKRKLLEQGKSKEEPSAKKGKASPLPSPESTPSEAIINAFANEKNPLEAHPVHQSICKLIKYDLSSSLAEACLNIWENTKNIPQHTLVSHALFIEDSQKQQALFSQDRLIRSLSSLYKLRATTAQIKKTRVASDPLSYWLREKFCSVLVYTIEALFNHPEYQATFFDKNQNGDFTISSRMLCDILALIFSGYNYSFSIHYKTKHQSHIKVQRLILQVPDEKISILRRNLKIFANNIAQQFSGLKDISPILSKAKAPTYKKSKEYAFVPVFPPLSHVYPELSGSITKYPEGRLSSYLKKQEEFLKIESLLKGLSSSEIKEACLQEPTSLQSDLLTFSQEVKLLEALILDLKNKTIGQHCTHKKALENKTEPPCSQCSIISYISKSSKKLQSLMDLSVKYDSKALAETLLKAHFSTKDFYSDDRSSKPLLSDFQMAFIHYLLSEPQTPVSSYPIDPRRHAPIFLSFAKTCSEGLLNKSVNICLRVWQTINQGQENFNPKASINFWVLNSKGTVNKFNIKKLRDKLLNLPKGYFTTSGPKSALKSKALGFTNESFMDRWLVLIRDTLLAIDQTSLQSEFFAVTEQGVKICTSSQLLEVACSTFPFFFTQRVFVPPSFESHSSREFLCFDKEVHGKLSVASQQFMSQNQISLEKRYLASIQKI